MQYELPFPSVLFFDRISFHSFIHQAVRPQTTRIPNACCNQVRSRYYMAKYIVPKCIRLRLLLSWGKTGDYSQFIPFFQSFNHPAILRPSVSPSAHLAFHPSIHPSIHPVNHPSTRSSVIHSFIHSFRESSINMEWGAENLECMLRGGGALGKS